MRHRSKAATNARCSFACLRQEPVQDSALVPDEICERNQKHCSALAPMGDQSRQSEVDGRCLNTDVFVDLLVALDHCSPVLNAN